MDRKAKATGKCCTDQHQKLKSEKSGSITYSQLTFATGDALPVVLPYESVDYIYVPLTIQYPVSKAPPAPPGIPVFLRNCNFRI